MAEKKREPQRATGEDPATQQVVALLTSILTEVRTQVGSSTSKPPDLATGRRTLEGDAATAVVLFREIGSTLALLPSITLTAEPTKLDSSGSVKLTWSSTEAQTVSIDPDVGEVSPPAGGSIKVPISRSTTFTATATARGPCGGATTSVDVRVGGGVIL
jgi:hypothetical protein